MIGDTACNDVLISGGGIAGLTLGILLQKAGWKPVIIERDPALRIEGYMMDFWGTGWDVAERIGILDDIRAVHYPIDHLQYVNQDGRPFISTPIERVRRALNGRYIYLRRSDLEKILFNRASALGIDVRFGTSIQAINENGHQIEAKFEDGSSGTFGFICGADGVHSRVRELVFGPENQFTQFLGYYVAAFHMPNHYGVGTSAMIYEEPGRVTFIYPIDKDTIDVVFVFAHPDIGFVPHNERLKFIRKKFDGAGWIVERLLNEVTYSSPIFFDSVTQIVMASWSKGRVVLLGDACGCLTLLAAQGSHMAMAGAYIISHELERYDGDYDAAFRAYEDFMKPFIIKKQREAVSLSRNLVPSKNSRIWLRRYMIKLIFSRLLIRYALGYVGAKSILEHYRA
jgi:2-polyprenyl-6-methoxyphenol hydroxylase-like FAD-dependent oxidoreductase